MEASMSTDEVLNDLILEISLAAALPMGVRGSNFILAASASNALANRASELKPSELKRLEHSVESLLALMRNQGGTNPVVVKAALSLRTLLVSRVNLLRFLELDGMHTLGQVIIIIIIITLYY
jgi:hypothetical protein